jgi:histone deacetylase complex regulatory component SIN3
VREEAQPIYPDFVETLRKYQKGDVTLPQVNLKMDDLLRPYPNLMTGYKNFLPELQKNEEQKQEPQTTRPSANQKDKVGQPKPGPSSLA